jgi:twinfilin-like protein
MLFASTRLTLVRELGIERFRETIFATERDELTAEGFRKHDAHVKLEAPLTEEEEALGNVKRAEMEEGRGSAGKRVGGSSIQLPIAEDALQALKGLPEADYNLVQLVSLAFNSWKVIEA